MKGLTIFTTLSVIVSGCSNALCTNQAVTNVRSPSGEHKAEMFMRECGATTDFTTQVSVDALFWQLIGNAFVADAYNGGSRGEWGGPWAEISWTGPNDLLVTYDKRARVFDQKTTVGDVHITYRAIDR